MKIFLWRFVMKPSRIFESLKVCIAAQQPAFMWGPPGVGKSDLVAQVAQALGYKLIDIRAVLLDPVDLRGLPHIEDGKAKWCPPAFLPRGKGKCILFLDELNAAPPLVQAACYQLVLDRKIGEYVLPKDAVVIAAGNRETDRAVTSRMPSPLANRFIHLDFDVDLDDWIVWGLNNGIRAEIIAFQRFRPELLCNFDPKRNEKAFSTPRSVAFLSRLMDANNGEIDFELVKGVTGEGYAAEFIGFLKIYKSLPDPDVVLLAPRKAEIPTDPATLYAICGAVSQKANESNMKNVVAYANRLPDEFSVLLIRDCINRDEGLVKTRAFITWTSEHADVLI
jgi:hypothetical protein